MAEAQVRIVPNTAGFRSTLVAELTKATAGLKVQIPVLAGAAQGAKAATAAQTELVAAQNAGVAAGRRLTRAQIDVANVFGAVVTAAQLEKKALADLDRQTVKTAAAHEQLARGAGATGLSLLGARGATLAAGNAFLIGAAGVTILAKAVQGAVEDEEALFGVTQVLGDALGKKLAADAGTLASSFGIADDQALKFEGALAATLRNAGVTGERIVELSGRLVRLAADLGAVRHVPVEDTLKAIQLAVSGNTRAMRQYGIVIQNAEVQQRALAQTGKDSTDELTRQELTAARVSLIFERASFAAGGFAKNSGSLANQMKILSANIDRLSDTLGALIVGPLTDVVSQANLAFDALSKLGSLKDKVPGGSFLDSVIGKARDFGLVASVMGPVGVQIKVIQAAVDLFTGSSDRAATSLHRLGEESKFVAINLNALRFDIASRAVDALSEHLTQLDIVGASSATRIAALQRQADEAQRAVRTAPTVAARRAARETRRQAIDEIRSIRASDAAAAEAAAAEAKAAAERRKREAEAAIRAQDQELLNRQELARGRLEIEKSKAERSESLFNDLVVARKEVALIKAQIVQAKQIHDATLEKQTIQKLTLDLAKAQGEIDDILAEQAKRAAERRQERFDRAKQSIELDIELAQTTENVQAEIAARRRLIALDVKRMNAIKNDTLAKKQLRNEIAANKQAIKDLKKENDDRNRAMTALEFSFLTTASGFVGTLLSNLIPRGVAAGTVGGGAINTATGSTATTVLATPTTGPTPGQGVAAAVQQNTTAGGATTGQMATVIHLLHQLVLLQQRATGRVSRPHPEATYQTYTGSTEMNVT